MTIDPSKDIWPFVTELTALKDAVTMFLSDDFYGEEYRGSIEMVMNKDSSLAKGRWILTVEKGFVKGCLEPSNGFDLSIIDFAIVKMTTKAGVNLVEQEDIAGFFGLEWKPSTS